MPVYESHRGQFKTVIHRDIYSEDMLLKAGINERQLKAVLYLKKYGKISNKDYRELCGVSGRTGTRDLMELVKKRILKQKGIKGAGANYVLG